MKPSNLNFEFNYLKPFYLTLFLVLVTLLWPYLLLAQQADSTQKRPKLGLVLSGGGAKGFAHIGAIKVFEEAGLKFDYVGGTSMGSIIGGLYALGYDSDEMMRIIRNQNWSHLLSDRIPRRYIPIEEKYNADRFVTTFPFRKRKIQLRQGLYSGEMIDLLLAHYTSQAYLYDNFGDLPLPFLCIGTNLEDGSSVILDKGILHQAMRASMSIPSYFTPINIDGTVLVDGGVVNNYPVQEVRDMGADIIVGVDVQAGLHHREQLTSMTKIMEQITAFHRTKANILGKEKTDIYINPDMGGFDMMSFDANDTIIKLGEAAARMELPRLKKLADSLNVFGGGNDRKLDAKPLDSVFVASIQYRGLKNVSRSFLEGALQFEAREWIQMDEITSGILSAYGSGFFESVKYHFLPDIEGVVLVVEVDEASSGILGAGIHYDSDYKVALLLNATFKNVFYKGSKLFIDLNLGENSRLSAFYLIDRGRKPGLGFKFTTFSLQFNDYDKDIIVDVFNTNQNKVEVFTQISRRKTLQFRTGFEYEYIKLDTKLDGAFGADYNSYFSLFASWMADTYDRSSFPTRGIQFNLKAKYIIPVAQNWDENIFSNALMFQLKFNKSTPLSPRSTLQSGFFAGFTIKDNLPPPQHWFILGGQSQNTYYDGFIPFYGLHFVEEAGLYTLVGNFAWQYNFHRKLYLSLKLNLGVIDSDFEDMVKNFNPIAGVGVALGYDSFIGPIEVSLMGSNQNDGIMSFVNIGYWF